MKNQKSEIASKLVVEPNHTPMPPWTCEKQSPATIALLRINGRTYDEQDYEVFEGDEPIALVKNKKIGDRIVRAVNSHEALIFRLIEMARLAHLKLEGHNENERFEDCGSVVCRNNKKLIAQAE